MKNAGFETAEKEHFYQSLKTGEHISELCPLPVWS